MAGVAAPERQSGEMNRVAACGRNAADGIPQRCEQDHILPVPRAAPTSRRDRQRLHRSAIDVQAFELVVRKKSHGLAVGRPKGQGWYRRFRRMLEDSPDSSGLSHKRDSPSAVATKARVPSIGRYRHRLGCPGWRCGNVHAHLGGNGNGAGKPSARRRR